MLYIILVLFLKSLLFLHGKKMLYDKIKTKLFCINLCVILFKNDIMKRIHTTIRYFVLFFLLSVGVLHAQLINNLYFLDNSPQRHHYNPSFQPLNNFYFGFPVLGNTQSNYSTNIPTFKEMGFNSGHKLNIEADKTQFLSAMSKHEMYQIFTENQINLLDIGFRQNKNYWTFSINNNLNVLFNMPYSTFDVFFTGFQMTDGYSANLTNSKLHALSYTETAIGFSRSVNERFGFGVKMKLLFGNNYFTINTNQLEFNYSEYVTTALADIHVTRASALDLDDKFNLIKPKTFLNYFLPEGFGSALDFGVHFNPISNLTLSAAVTDLGLIRWRKLNTIDYQLDYQFDEDDASAWEEDHPDFIEVPMDSVVADMKNSFVVNRSELSEKSNNLNPKLNVSAEFGIMNNLMSFGLLSRSMFREQKLLHVLTTAFNIRPAEWVNLALSYSITNSNGSTFGLGANFRSGIFNFFLSADYIPFQYVKLNIHQFNPVIPSITFPLSYHSDKFNFALGFNFAI